MVRPYEKESSSEEEYDPSLSGESSTDDYVSDSEEQEMDKKKGEAKVFRTVWEILYLQSIPHGF